MGLKDLVKNTIWRIDLLSAPPTFRTRQQPAYESLFGGIVSIIVLGVFYYFLYVQLSDMFQKLTITYNTGVSDDVSSTSAITSFPMAVSIDGVDLGATPKKFIFFLYQNKIVKNIGGPPTTTQTNVALAPCNQSDWTSYGTDFTSQFSAFGFGQMLCIQSGQNISLAGYTGSDTYEYLSLQIVQCDQAMDASCDTAANINSYISSHVSTNDYFKVKLFVVDTIVTPSNDDAISSVLEKDIFLAFSDTMGTVGSINIAQFELKTDTSLLPISSYDIETGIYIEDFTSNAVSLSTTRYIHFNVYRSTQYMSITRTIGKLDTVLSYVGGLFSLLFTAISFAFGSYSQYKYQLYVAESTLTDNKGKREKADKMGFFTFVIYCCYDWMDSFGCAPTCLERYKRIHDIRSQSCEQLDPSLMLRRIKHLEDTTKVLVNEEQRNSLYLSEPMNLDEAKKMRMKFDYTNEIMDKVEEHQSRNGVANEYERRESLGQKQWLDNESQVRPQIITNQEEKELTEDEQKQFLGNLIYDAIDRLDSDNSEVGRKIRAKISQKMKKWVKENKKKAQFEELTGNNKQEMISPSDIVNEDDSANNLTLKTPKPVVKFNFRRSKY